MALRHQRNRLDPAAQHLLALTVTGASCHALSRCMRSSVSPVSAHRA
jgi:hypothetical protein